jgi:hypothetical protein
MGPRHHIDIIIYLVGDVLAMSAEAGPRTQRNKLSDRTKKRRLERGHPARLRRRLRRQWK